MHLALSSSTGNTVPTCTSEELARDTKTWKHQGTYHLCQL